MLAEEINGSLGRFSHVFHEQLLAGPYVPVLGQVVLIHAVNLCLADAAGCAADSQIFHGAAEAAHGVTLEVRQHEHGVVVDDVFAHGNFFEVLAVADGQINCALCVHDVDRAERPAVDLQRFQMALGGIAVTLIERVGFYDGAVGDLLLQRFDQLERQNVGPVLFAGVQLDSYHAVYTFVD